MRRSTIGSGCAGAPSASSLGTRVDPGVLARHILEEVQFALDLYGAFPVKRLLLGLC
jgi:hypothetical protein